MIALLQRYRLTRLKWRESILEQQACDAHELILSTTRQYDMLINEHRRVRQKIAMLTPAADMLAEFNERKSA